MGVFVEGVEIIIFLVFFVKCVSVFFVVVKILVDFIIYFVLCLFYGILVGFLSV